MARLTEQGIQGNISHLRNVLSKVEHYYDLDAEGTSYEIKEKLPIHRIIDDKYVFLNDRDWIKKWFRKIVGRGGIRWYDKDDFDENGNLKDQVLEIHETFAFETTDGGRLVWDFYGYDDSEGNLEIQEPSAEADVVLYVLRNTVGHGVDINDVYFQLTGKSSI